MIHLFCFLRRESRWLMLLKSQTAIGGGGGDIGKRINHGGGDGGDDDGDDDDYFDNFDDGDEGDEGGLFRRRRLLEEVKIHYIQTQNHVP